MGHSMDPDMDLCMGLTWVIMTGAFFFKIFGTFNILVLLMGPGLGLKAH